jgi:hypothetical protein
MKNWPNDPRFGCTNVELKSTEKYIDIENGMVSENETHFLCQFVWRRLTFCIVEKWKIWRTKGEIPNYIYVFVSNIVLICWVQVH